MLSYAVARRRSEISIRMAIGAQTSHVVRSVVRESVLAVGVGAIAGTLASIAMTQWLQTLLFGVSSVDPMALGGAAGVFLTVAGLAAAIPARAASRVDRCWRSGSSKNCEPFDTFGGFGVFGGDRSVAFGGPSHQHQHQGLLRVETVLGLIEHHRR
jgi:predicted lysophospholipase L1 biosynthesis ABC-type transport system permease subunit